MNTLLCRGCAAVLAALLAAAPAALRAQQLRVSPTLASLSAAGGTASLDALLDEGTAALVEQVRVLTEPGQTADAVPAADLPCGEQPIDRVTQVASERPIGLLSRAAWEVWAWRTLRRLHQPLPVCFPAGRVRPDRMFENVIRFNSDWMSSEHGRGGRYRLLGFAAVREDSALARQRASWVVGVSDPWVRPRLTPASGGRSQEIGVARWVRYEPRARR